MLGLIPRPFIDELLNRTDIVEYIDSYVPLKKSGTSYTACCPFHNEKTPSFNVIPKKQFYHCFGCGTNGNAISFAMNHLHMSFSDAIEALAARLGLTVPREGNLEKNQQTLDHYQFLNKVAQFYQQTLKKAGLPAVSYLKQRHITGEVARLYQLGYAPPAWQTLEFQFKHNKKELLTTGMLITTENGRNYDRYRHRIMFPIHDRHGRIIGFGGRAIDATQKPKYLNSPETIIFQKSRELYGLHQVLQQNKTLPSIVIVEGYIDVISLAQHGVLNAVATLGTSTSAYHIQLLSKYTQQLIFCFDGDTAGKQAAWRALESSLPHVNSGLDARFIFLPEEHDPDSLIHQEGKAAFLLRMENATPLNRFFIETLSQGINITTIAGKSQLINAMKPYLLKMEDGIYKQLLLEEIARLTHIESHRLQQLLIEKPQAKNTPEKNKNITRSPIRLAIALLLQTPEIYGNCAAHLDPDLLDAPKQRVLKTLIQQVAADPTINTAKLIELWRDSTFFDSLTQLAAWDHKVPSSALTKEFIDIILFLIKQNREKSIQQLLEKAHNQGLTEIERRNLQEKLQQRHKGIGGLTSDFNAQ